MKTVFIGICSILFLASLFFLFSRILKQTRKKSSLYLHRSELEPTPTRQVMELNEGPEQKADVEWGRINQE